MWAESCTTQRSGFTLIELLVVVSIIGLLSSVILAGLNSAREKGRIASMQIFDTHTFQALGINALGSWNLDDGVGTVARNSMGSIDGTISNGSWVSGITNTSAISFSGSGLVSIPYSSSYPDYSQGLTISVWVKTSGAVGNWSPLSMTEGVEGRGWWFGFFGGTTNRIHWSNGGLSSNDLSCYIPDTLNTWRLITVTYKSGVGRKMYVDGKFICKDSSTGSIVRSSGTIYNGGGGGYSGLNGTMQNLRIYAEALNL
jgi:prepilin-type N-terminal cleavage/methylation domain-containing protein